MAISGLFWIELGLGLSLLLLTAKAHGRQIRLERELEGYMEVDFMRENPPWVEALWKRDRRQFWITFAFAAVLLAAFVAAAGLVAKFGTEPFGSPVAGALLLAVALWAPVVAFIGNGITSAARLHRSLLEPRAVGPRRDEIRGTRGPWLAAVVRGTYGWWSLVAIVVSVAISLVVA